MKYKKPKIHHIYKSTCQFWIYDDKAVIHINEKEFLMVLGPFMLTIGIALLAFSILTYNWFFIRWILILIFLGLVFTFLNQKVEIHIKEKKFISKTYFNRFCISTHSTSWDENSNLKFIILNNSLDNITGITLIVRNSKEKNNIWLMEFTNQKFFFIFHKKFNEHFPDFRINEWFDK